MANKTKFSQKAVNMISQMVEVGVPVTVACECEGISVSTWYDWIKKGRKCTWIPGKPKLEEFINQKAGRRNAALVLKAKELAFGGNPAMLKMLLEAYMPEVFKRTVEHNVRGRIGHQHSGQFEVNGKLETEVKETLSKEDPMLVRELNLLLNNGGGVN